MRSANEMELLNELSDLSVETQGMISIAMALYDAMEYGPNTKKSYVSGIWVLEGLLRSHAKKLSALQGLEDQQ